MFIIIYIFSFVVLYSSQSSESHEPIETSSGTFIVNVPPTEPIAEGSGNVLPLDPRLLSREASSSFLNLESGGEHGVSSPSLSDFAPNPNHSVTRMHFHSSSSSLDDGNRSEIPNRSGTRGVTFNLNSTRSQALSESGHSRMPLERKQTSVKFDKEASSIPEVAPILPSERIQNMKRTFVDVSDMMGVLCSAGYFICGTLSLIGVGNYLSDIGILSLSAQSQIFILATIGAAVFKGIQSRLKLVKLRDERHLISYDRKKEEDDIRGGNGDAAFYSREEIDFYLKKNNIFLTLPSKKSFALRWMIFNSMCFLESYLCFIWATCAGVAAATLTSGVLDMNLLGVSEQKVYRKLSFIFGGLTGFLIYLERNRREYKQECEQWIENYQKLVFYFLYIRGIEKENLYKRTRYVPEEYITAQTEETIQQMEHAI